MKYLPLKLAKDLKLSFIPQLLLIVFIITCSQVIAQSKFKRQYSNSGYFEDGIKTQDGGILGVGNGGRIVKIDYYGDTEWSLELEAISSNYIFYNSMIQNTFGDYFILISVDSESILVKITNTGSFIMAKSFSYSNSGGHSMVSDDDGGAIFTGGGCLKGAFVIRCDKDLNIVWEKSYKALEDGSALKIVKTSSGNFVIGGTDYVGTSEQPQILFEIDINGNLIWSKIYNGFVMPGINQIIELTSGGFMFAGYGKFIEPNQFTDIYFTRTDSIGNVIWTKLLIDSIGWEQVTDLIQMEDESILFSGVSDYSGNSDALLGKISLEGNILMLKNIPSENFNGIAYDVIEKLIPICENKIAALGAIDGMSLGFINANCEGFCNSSSIPVDYFNLIDTLFEELDIDFTVLATQFIASPFSLLFSNYNVIEQDFCNYVEPNANPCYSASTNINSFESMVEPVLIYPNPATTQLTIDYKQLVINEIQIVDYTGKVLSVSTNNLSNIDVSNLKTGIYFIKLISNKKVITKKFVKH
jgi:hypothetical protein